MDTAEKCRILLLYYGCKYGVNEITILSRVSQDTTTISACGEPAYTRLLHKQEEKNEKKQCQASHKSTEMGHVRSRLGKLKL